MEKNKFKKQIQKIENSVAQYLGVSVKTCKDLGWETADFTDFYLKRGGK
jgi:hypothetical protein